MKASRGLSREAEAEEGREANHAGEEKKQSPQRRKAVRSIVEAIFPRKTDWLHWGRIVGIPKEKQEQKKGDSEWGFLVIFGGKRLANSKAIPLQSLLFFFSSLLFYSLSLF